MGPWLSSIYCLQKYLYHEYGYLWKWPLKATKYSQETILVLVSKAKNDVWNIDPVNIL